MGTARFGMIEAFEGACDVARDGNGAGAVNVIEGKGDSTVLFGVPIDAGGVKKLQRVQEVLCAGLIVGVLYIEVVDNEGESEGPGAMFPEARGDGDRSIAVRSEEFDKTIIGEVPRLGQAVHALSNFDICVAIMDEFDKIVLEHDGVGNDTY